MASQRIKGQEVEISVVADGRVLSFVDINSGEFSSETETLTEGFLGEKSDRYDEIYKGYTGSISMQNSSSELFEFLQIVKDRAQRRTPGTVVNVKMTLNFPSGERARVIMQDAFFDASGISFGSRDAYGDTTIPFKGSEWRVL